MKNPSEVVFVGTVLSTGAGNHPYLWRYTFRVEELFAGPSTKEIDIYSTIGCCACGINFRVGERYLIDGWSGKDGLISTGICDKTRQLDASDLLLTELRAIRDGKKPDSLFGVLKRAEEPKDGPPDRDYNQPLSGRSISLRSAEHSYQTTSDADGNFRFPDVAPGKYSISADLPTDRALGLFPGSHSMRPVTVAADACGEYNLNAYPSRSTQ